MVFTGQKLGGALVGLVGGIGPSCTAVGNHVGTLGAEHFCCGHDFFVVMA